MIGLKTRKQVGECFPPEFIVKLYPAAIIHHSSLESQVFSSAAFLSQMRIWAIKCTGCPRLKSRAWNYRDI